MDDVRQTRGTVVFAFGKLLLAAYFITGILLLILAMLLYKLHISQSVVNVGIVVIYCISTFLAGFLAGKSKKQRRFLWGLALGCAYFALLGLISVAVKGSVKEISGDFLTALILCTGSGMLGGMLS